MSCTRSQKKRSLDQTGSTEELPPSKRKIKEKQRRRSSFMRGRNRRSLLPPTSNISELYKKIPSDETEEKRLALLHQVCFEYTINRLEEEMPNAKGFEEFKSKARSTFNKTIDDLEKEECFKDSCSIKKIIQNPVNIKLEETATKIQEQHDALLGESKKWEELLTEAKELASETQRSLNSSSCESLTALPDTLSKQDSRFISGLPDLNQVLSSTKSSLDKMEIQMDTILTTFKALKEFECNTDAYLSKQVKLIAQNSETDTDLNPLSIISGTTFGKEKDR